MHVVLGGLCCQLSLYQKLILNMLPCSSRKRTIISEYGPILDSKNPLSLNSDHSIQGNVILLICQVFVQYESFHYFYGVITVLPGVNLPLSLVPLR